MTATEPEIAEPKFLWLSAEGLNCLTHALGLLLSLVAAERLVAAVRGGDRRLVVAGCLAYAVTLVALYAASTLSHSFERPAVRHFFRTVDQMCIFLLIAGSYTPWGVGYFSDPLGMLLLGAIWLLAISGALFKLLVKGLNNVAVAFYVLLGWLPMLGIKPIIDRVPLGALTWLVAGGVLYTLGTYFLTRDDRRPYFHAIWHLLVIGASACHYFGVMQYVVPLCFS